MIKDILNQIATKYNVAITYQDNSAEITGFSSENGLRLIAKKVNCKIDIEDELDKLGVGYTMVSSFNPDKLSLTIKEAK